MTSAAVAVTLTEWRRGHHRNGAFFAIVSAIFLYTITVTIIDRPEGLLIALIFIVMILVDQPVLADQPQHRAARRPGHRRPRAPRRSSTGSIADLRPIRFIANKLQAGDADEYDEKMAEVQLDNHLGDHEDRIFLEVQVTDASDFETFVEVTSVQVGRHHILRATGSSVPNVIAAFLLHVRDLDTQVPHVYFEWSESAPGQNVLRFLIAGEGDIPPLTHEILRKAEPDETRRPQVHAGG